MADENTSEDEKKQEQQTVEEIQQDRRAVKDQAKRERLQSELADANTKLAEREASDQKAEDERLRAAGDYEKLEAKHRTEMRGKDERLADFEAKDARRTTDERRTKFTEAVAKAGGVANLRAAKAILATLDVETAPENFTDKDARDAAKLLRVEAPELFGTGTNDPKPPPGGGKAPPEEKSPEWYRQRAKDFSSQQLGGAYARATGRATE